MYAPVSRMLLCIAFVVLCWDIKPVFYAIWKPFTWLVGYVDPRKPSDDVLYGEIKRVPTPIVIFAKTVLVNKVYFIFHFTDCVSSLKCKFSVFTNQGIGLGPLDLKSSIYFASLFNLVCQAESYICLVPTSHLPDCPLTLNPSEWYFRSSLDRYVWIYGMFCAWIHPHVSAAFIFMDNLPPARKFAVRGAVLSVTAVITYFWYTLVYCLPKLEYNQVQSLNWRTCSFS
jgi:hypothetical protein